MSLRNKRRNAWSVLLLSATFSASLLSFSGISDGQQTTNPQQTLETTLQRHQQELEQLLHQHEIQRQAVTKSIDQLGSVIPVDNAAVTKLHAQLTELHKRQQEEKQSLAKRQTAESNVLRGIVNPKPGGGTTPAVDINDPEIVENERIAHLKLVPGVTKTDAAGVPVAGSVAVLVSGETFDLDVAIAGLQSADDVSVIEVVHAVTGELIASLSGRDLRSVGGIPRPAETEFGAVPEPLPEWLMMDTGFAATPSFLQALANDQVQVIVKSAQYPDGFLKGTFGLLDMDKIRRLALHKESLPIPVVVDRSFKKLGTVNELVIQDEAAAIQLGKALFWDVQVGADNKTACATCHNFGGADWRTKNQLASGGNRELKLADFVENDGRLNDIVGSQGVVQEKHVAVNPPGKDLGEVPTVQELVKKFTLNGTVESRTRQVTGRNTPSVINAAYYARQFWDGRAHRFFNGENIFGTQDPDAGVWENNNGLVTKNTNFLVDYSSLASQAVGPVGSSVEMAHGPDGSRTIPELGKKLLDASLRPLGLQKVHANDSVLSSLVAANGVGLKKSYAEMIRQAFKPQFWNYEGGEVAGHTQMEANFALFFGLAVQAYERTLISDESRFDKFARGEDVDLTYDEKEGLLRYFNSSMGCTTCHDGSMFSAATWSSLSSPVEAMSLMNTTAGLYDNGFYNIGVQDQKLDAGIGRMDLPFGPISLSKLATGVTNSNRKVAPAQQWPNLSTSIPLPAKVEGMFKTPTLRNVELTAPYFHTGNYATLEDTMNFYADGGDFPANPHLDDDMHPIRQLLGYPERVAQMAAFLRTLTDERVRHRSAPFDHPELAVPNGHSAGTNGTALDEMVVLEATGSQGSSVSFPMFTDRLGATTPKSGSSSVAGSVVQITAGMTADQIARAKDAQMNQLNQQMNQAQAQFNAETQAVNAQLNSGAITPEQQNVQLAGIDARRNARMRQLNELMAALNSGTTMPASTTGGATTGGTMTGGTTVGGTTTPTTTTGGNTSGGTATSGTPATNATTGFAPVVLTVPVDPLDPVIPSESLNQLITGNVQIADRRADRGRFDVLVTDVSVGVLSNANNRINNGTISAGFLVMVDGMTAEFLDANDNVIAVTTAFEAEFQTADLVTLAFSIRDAQQLALLSGVSKIRVSQAEPGTLSLVELATVSSANGSTVAITAPTTTGGATTGGATTGGATTGGATTGGATTGGATTGGATTGGATTGGATTGGATTGGATTGGATTGGATTGGATTGGATTGGATTGGAATGGAATGGAAGGGADPEVDGGIETVTVVGDVNVQYGFEGPMTSADRSGFIVMNRVKVDMSNETRPIPGTMGDHDGNPATPEQELTYAQLGDVLSAATPPLTYDDLVNHRGLQGYIAKGIGAIPAAAAGTNAAIVPAIDPATNDFVEFVFEPRENVLAGVLTQVAGTNTEEDPSDDRFQLGGVAVTSSDLVGFPKVTHEELLAAVNSDITLVGHYMFDQNTFFAREAELPPEGAAIEVVQTNVYEGPITDFGLDDRGYFIEVMGSRLYVAADMEIPAVTPLPGQRVFRGEDIPFLADDQRGPYQWLPIIGATFAGETLADGNNNVSSVGFIELAENVIVAPVSVQENIVFPQLPGMIAQSVTLSGDERFRGDWMDVGGVRISIGQFDTIDQLSNETATGMLFGMVGYYDAKEKLFWVVEGETEYHPEGTVRITRALGRQGDGNGRLEIRGQVKPTPNADGTIEIPAQVFIDAGTMGTYNLATTPAVDRIPVGVDPLNIPAGFANVGTFRISLRTGNQTSGTIVPELVVGEVHGRPEIGGHYKNVDIRDVRTPAGSIVPLEPGIVPASANLLDAVVTADGQLADGVNAAIQSSPGQQRVDITISAPQSLFGPDLFAALDLTNPEAALAIDPAALTLTATDARGNASEVPVAFLAVPDPNNAGSVLIETSIRGQFAVDLAGRTLTLQLQSGTNRVALQSGRLNAGLVFTPGAVVPGVAANPVQPAAPVAVAVIGVAAEAGVPVESLAAALTGTVTVDNRIADQQRLTVNVTGVPVTNLANQSGLFVNGQVPAGLNAAVTGLTVEFLNADGDIIAVSPHFTAAFQTASTVDLSLTVRDAAQLASLADVTEVRLQQSVNGVLGISEITTLPIQGSTTVLVAVVP